MNANEKLVKHLQKLSPDDYEAFNEATATILNELIKMGPEFRFANMFDLVKAIHQKEKFNGNGKN